MKLSTRTEYGVRAMLDLAERAGSGPVQSHDIASRQGIPEPYLNQLLTLLRKASLIASRRGPGGGHMLSRPASQISLAEVVGALEGPLWLAEDPPDDEGRPGWPLVVQEVWQEVDTAVQGILGRITLEDLTERERQRALSYTI